jgi:hypothetical protein
MSKIVFIPGFVATVTTIVIDSTPIVGGASGRILFENAANQISESANFTYLAGIFNVTKTATHQAQFTFDVNNYFRIKATNTGATELSATGTAPKFLFNADVDTQTSNVYAAKIGVGTITPAAILEVLGITQQARFSYNASNGLGVTVASNGSTTFALTGTAPEFTFSQTTNIVSAAGNATQNIKAGLGASARLQGYVNSLDYAKLDWDAAGLSFVNGAAARAALPFKFKNGSGKEMITINMTADLTQNGFTFTSTNGGDATIASSGTDANINLSFNAKGTARILFLKGISVTGTIRSTGYTVATLPAGVVGDTAYVTDALAPIFLGIIAGGGAVVTPVFYNGANWIAQ